MSPDASTPGSLSPTTVFEILSNRRRRMVLYYLRDRGGPVSVDELAAAIAAMENDVPVEELTRRQRKRVYVSLYQTHVPKLDDVGVIQYEDDEVRIADRARTMDRYLTSKSSPEYAWQWQYLLVAVGGGLVFGLSELGVPGVASIPSLALGLALVTAFGLLAANQYWRIHRQRQKIPQELLEHEQ